MADRFRLSKRSLDKMAGVHPDLVRVVKRAIEITEVDFGITEGLRSLARQKQLLAAGASRTLKSKHLKQPTGYGHAVDVAAFVAGKVRWDWPLYPKIATAMKAAACELGVRITWGGDWRSFRDGPHYEIK